MKAELPKTWFPHGYGGAPQTDRPIDLFRVFVDPSASDAVREVLTPDENGRTYVGQGKVCEAFEREFQALIGAPRPPLLVNSCTSALTLALDLCGVKAGDWVISTPQTCTATNTVVLNLGASILWADVDPVTGLVDPESVHDLLSVHGPLRRVKAIIGVDWGGMPCDYAALKSFGIPVIEDAAHRVRLADRHGDYVCWSFQAIKFLTCGDGGALLCPDDDKHAQAKLLRWYGLDRESGADFRCVHPSTKIRMAKGPAVQAAKVFKDRLEGPVLVLENGALVERRIIDWHANPRKGRRFLKVWCETFGERECATVTEDHLIQTKRGWVRADELIEGDMVATCYSDLSQTQRQVLLGGLLGDSALGDSKKSNIRIIIHETCSAVNRPYLERKAAALAGLGCTIHDRAPDPTHPYGSVHLWSRVSPALTEFRRAFYPEGKKAVPRSFIDREGLSDLALAVWYMDDGSTTVHNHRDGLVPYCHLATNGFQMEDVEWLAGHLCKEGIACHAAFSSGWRLTFTKEGSRRLVERIARYVPPSMRYKVAHLPELDQYDPESWGDGSSPCLYDRCHVEVRSETNWNNYQTAYCFTVEGGSSCFAAGPVIVHNCSQNIQRAGWKFQSNDIAAAIGRANLPTVMDRVDAARANSACLIEECDNPKVEQPCFGVHVDPWLHTVLVEDRDGFIAHMKARGIAASPVHRRNDEHACFARFKRHLPGVDAFSSRECAVPNGWWVTERELDRVIEAVNAW